MLASDISGTFFFVVVFCLFFFFFFFGGGGGVGFRVEGLGLRV